MVARGKKRGGGAQRAAASAPGEQAESSAAADQHEDDSALGDEDIEGSSELAGDQEEDEAREAVSALDTATGEDGEIEGEAGEFMDESFEGEGDEIITLEEDEDEAIEGESSLQDMLGNDMEVLDQTGDSDPEHVGEEFDPEVQAEENGDGANIAWVEELWNLKQAEDAKDGEDQDLDKSNNKKGKKDKDPSAEASKGEGVSPKKTDTGCEESERMDVTEGDMEEEPRSWSRNEVQKRNCCIPRSFLGKFFDEKESEYNITIHPVVQNDYPRGELRAIIFMASSVRFVLEPTKNAYHKMMKLNVRGNRIAEVMESILFCTFTSNNMHFKVERRKAKSTPKPVKGAANTPDKATSGPEDIGQIINTVSFQQKNAFARRTLMMVDAPLGGTVKKRSLFLHNLPSSVDEKFLSVLFPRCLKAGLVKVSNDVRSAVLQMSNPQIAHNHLISFTNYFIDGREIQMGVQDMSQEDALANYYKGQHALAARRDPKVVRKDADTSRSEKKDQKDKDSKRDSRSSSNRREESASGKKTSSVSSGAKGKTGDGKSSSGKKDEKEPAQSKAESEKKAKALKEKKEREQKERVRRNKERQEREQRDRKQHEREQKDRQQTDRRRSRTDYAEGPRNGGRGVLGRSPRGHHHRGPHEHLPGHLGGGRDGHYFEEMERRRAMGWEGVVQAEEEMRMEMQQEMELREIRLQREMELERLKQEQLAEMERRKMEREEKERLHLLMLEQQERQQRLQREEAARRLQEMEDQHRRKRQQEERQERARQQERERKAEQQRLQKARDRERQLEREALQKQREQERRAASAAVSAGWEQSSAKRSRFDSPHSSGRDSHFQQGDGSYGDSFRPEGNKLHSRQKFRPGQDYRNSGAVGEGEGDMRLTLEQEVAKQADELKRNLALLEQFQQDPSRAAQHLAKVDPSLAIGKQSMRDVDMDMDSDPMQQPFLPGRTIPTIAAHSAGRHRPAGQGRQQQQDYGQVFEDYEQELRGGSKDFPQWQQQQQRPGPQTGRAAGAQSQRGKQQRSGRGGRQAEGFVARGGTTTEQSMFAREDNMTHLSYGKGAAGGGGSFQQQPSRGKGGFSARQGAVQQRDMAYDRSSQPLPSAREEVSHRAGLLGKMPDPYAEGDYQSNRGQREQFSLQGAEETFYGTPGGRRQDPVSSHRGRGQGHGLQTGPGRDYNHGRAGKGVNRQSYY